MLLCLLFICINVYVYMYVYVCLYMYVYMCVYVYIYTCIYVCMYIYIYVCVCMYVCVCVYVCICLYVYMHVCIHVLIYICLLFKRCEYMWMGVFCVCVCLCLFVCLLVSIYISQHKCLWKVNEISVCIFFHLGCYLSVWHCYLGSILAFNAEVQISDNLWTKPLIQLKLIIWTVYLCLIPRVTCIYFSCHE